jgi:hypothetical protein
VKLKLFVLSLSAEISLIAESPLGLPIRNAQMKTERFVDLQQQFSELFYD